jgi:hypothetical protein
LSFAAYRISEAGISGTECCCLRGARCRTKAKKQAAKKGKRTTGVEARGLPARLFQGVSTERYKKRYNVTVDKPKGCSNFKDAEEETLPLSLGRGTNAAINGINLEHFGRGITF